MFHLRRVLVGLGICLLTALPVRAFTFLYGQAFSVAGLSQKKGKLHLPLAQRKYANVKITGKDLYRFLQTCREDCSYPAENIAFATTDLRRALSRQDMFIAEVEFNGEVVLTFLVFTHADGVSVQAPKGVMFMDKPLQQQVYRYLTESVQNDTVQL